MRVNFRKQAGKLSIRGIEEIILILITGIPCILYLDGKTAASVTFRRDRKK